MALRMGTKIFLPVLSLGALVSCSVGPKTVGLTPGPAASGTTGTALATFRDGGLVFSFPPAWRIFHHDVFSSFSSSISLLSTYDLHVPRNTTHVSVGTPKP